MFGQNVGELINRSLKYRSFSIKRFDFLVTHMNRFSAHRPSELSRRYEHSISISKSVCGTLFRITPVVHEVRAARKRSRFRGRSNLVEPDEVSGGRRPRTVLRF